MSTHQFVEPGHAGRRPGLRGVALLCLPLLTAAAHGTVSLDSPFTDQNDPLAGEIEVLAGMSIEDLMRLRVTTVAGIEAEWLRSPAAMYVISPRDIRRSGHLHLAEALRLAPGMFVGRSNSSSWRVGARGFSGGLANKNLVLIDGRSVYDPLHGGVFWDVNDILFEDLDRIEVIRGPGATLWGANAMNGVINVITRSARDTQGLYITGGGGTYERGFGAVRYGAPVPGTEDTWFRIYTTYANMDAFRLPGGGRGHDDWSVLHTGFRLDHHGDDHLQITFQGEVHTTPTRGERLNIAVPGAHLQQREVTGDGRASGGHALFRIGQSLPEGRGWSLQGYYDRVDRRQSADFHFRRDTFSVDYRNFFRWGAPEEHVGHEFIWGLGYRHITDRADRNDVIFLDPSGESFNDIQGFIQNTFTLVPRQWFFMAGSKFGYTNFTGFEMQPSGRLWWQIDEKQIVWGAVSRPVRLPSRLERDGTLVLAHIDPSIAAGGPPSGTFVPLSVAGNRDLSAERMVAYELGYRAQATPELLLSFTGYFNDYSRLISVPPGTFGTWNNDGRGDSRGFEVWADWRFAPNWRLIGSYAFVDVRMRAGVDPFEVGSAPQQLAQLRSMLDITDDLEFNTALYFVDRLRRPTVPEYFRLDVGVTWRPAANVELAVWGQNLLHPGHRETGVNEFPRGVYLQGTLRY